MPTVKFIEMIYFAAMGMSICKWVEGNNWKEQKLTVSEELYDN